MEPEIYIDSLVIFVIRIVGGRCGSLLWWDGWMDGWRERESRSSVWQGERESTEERKCESLPLHRTRLTSLWVRVKRTKSLNRHSS